MCAISPQILLEIVCASDLTEDSLRAISPEILPDIVCACMISPEIPSVCVSEEGVCGSGEESENGCVAVCVATMAEY